MTLFRKVFQNQSRPATGDEALDDEALRNAFMERSDSRVLPLDPFSVADADGEEAPEEADDVMAQFGLHDDRPHKHDAPLETGDETDAEDQSDASVTDALDGAQETQQQEDGADDSAADIAAVLAQTKMMDPSPQASAEPPADGAGEGAVSGYDAGAGSHADDQEPAAEGAEPSEEEDTQDLVAFAQKQLQAQKEDGNAAPQSDAPPLVDLSAAPLANGPTPAAGRVGRRAGRVKTRMLGFNRSEPEANDPFGNAQNATAKPQREKFPVGWLVVVEGPGMGHSFSIFSGASMIGRGDDQVIKLDFGDNSISRNNHAAIAYDEEDNKFYIGHGGKSNIIRRNARPVLSTEELHHADLLRIGETTLRFVALCGSDFKWEMTGGNDAAAV